MTTYSYYTTVTIHGKTFTSVDWDTKPISYNELNARYKSRYDSGEIEGWYIQPGETIVW